MAPSTLEAYAQQYRRHVGPRFARVRLDEVTALELSRFARGLREGGLAPLRVAVAMAVIRDLLVDAAALIELGVPEVLQDERLGHHPAGMRSIYGHTTRHMHEEPVDGLQELCEREPTRNDQTRDTRTGN